MDIQEPLAFILILLLPWVLKLKRKTRKKLPFVAVGGWLGDPDGKKIRRYYEDIIYCLAFFCMVAALANITYSEETVEEFFESKWIFLALDVSGSMQRAVNPGSDKSLGDAALDGAEAFIDLRAENDYIGIVGFSSQPRLIAPLSFDRRLLKQKLDLLRSKNQSRIYRELSAGGGTNASEAVWLALSAFFSMLPPENRLSIDELARLRAFLLGPPGDLLDIPQKVQSAAVGRGMAVILFTDGRIEPSLRAHGSDRLPNLVNIIRLMRTLGIRLYIIAVGGDIDEEVRRAMKEGGDSRNLGRIFVTSKHMAKDAVDEVYREIDHLEANRHLTRLTTVKISTQNHLTAAALLLVAVHFLMRGLRRWRRL